MTYWRSTPIGAPEAPGLVVPGTGWPREVIWITPGDQLVGPYGCGVIAGADLADKAGPDGVQRLEHRVDSIYGA